MDIVSMEGVHFDYQNRLLMIDLDKLKVSQGIIINSGGQITHDDDYFRSVLRQILVKYKITNQENVISDFLDLLTRKV